MNNFDALKIENPAWEALRQMQENSVFAAVQEWQKSGAFAALKEMQSTLNAVRVPMAELNASIKEYQRLTAPIAESLKIINTVYAPMFKQTILSDTMNLKTIISGVQSSASVMRTLSGLNLSNIASIFEQLPKYDFSSDLETDGFTVDDAEKLYENGEITQDDINEELSEIVEKKQFSPVAEWDKLKKSKWFFAIKILLGILLFFGRPIIEYTEDKVLDAIGITQLYEEFGVFETIDSMFANFEEGTVSEEEAKATVDEAKTGNITKQKREDLLAKIKEIRTFISSAPQDDNTGNLLSYLSELEKDVCGKKYGLVFEEHREDIDEVLDTHTPVLTEETGLFIDNKGQMNFLIEGDNLASLKLLEKTHKGKIDLIYIDPPYNTLSEGFIYSDVQIDKNDTFQHSKWSSLIYNRIKCSKKLLSNKGVIFISIDDNELYSLKFLCDEIFGVENYISTIAVIVKPEGRRYGAFAKTHEYILVYANDVSQIQLNEIEVEGSKYKYYDEQGGFNLKGLRNRNVRAFNSTNRPNLRYPFYVEINNPNEDGLCDVSTEPKEGFVEVWASTVDGLESVWRWGKETATVKIKDLVAYRGKDNEIRIFQKERKLTQTAKTIWAEKEFISQKGTKEIQSILGKGKFDFPKPLELISRIVKIGTEKETIVLDFFAGSGTTGHAVMKLNAEDGGNRKFILCTNNENNICRDVTYERIKRVIDKEGYEASLKYYKVEYIPISERMYYEYADDLLLHIRELVELENGVNFKGNAEIGIVLTEEELDEFIENVDAFSKCKKLYMGHDLLPNDEQEEILKARDIEISIIPDYYYRDLQEG